MTRRAARSTRWAPAFAWVALAAGVFAAPAGRADSVDEDGSELAIGVAPFEGVAPPGVALPDLATMLADRIGTRGVHRIVGPAQLAAAPVAEPEPSVVKGWAARAGVAAVVVGRTTRVGSQLSVDVRLRSGESGAVAATYVAEIPRVEELEAAIDRLAGQVVDGAFALLEGGDLPAVTSRGQVAAPERRGPAEAGSGDGSLSNFVSFDNNQPIFIESQELEAFQSGGARRLIFKRDVKVSQADVKITSDRLEAFYPEEANQPDRLVASGSVTLVQASRVAKCEEATYDRLGNRVVCRGNAELRDGEDRVRGQIIEFDLASERVTVTGGASVVIHPSGDGANGRGGTGG